MFQSTFPRGKRRNRAYGRYLNESVSIHVPARETTYLRLKLIQSQAFQSTFPRGKRREKSGYWKTCTKFQSTFPRGKRHYSSGCDTDGECSFNPRSREGNDNNSDCRGLNNKVSIHVPARETTIRFASSVIVIPVSIHVPARETTVIQTINKVLGDVVSIHVPARETTKNRKLQLYNRTVSIHVPARETTAQADKQNKWNAVSIHVPARETTCRVFLLSSFPFVFQSTFPRGKRLYTVLFPLIKNLVSIHVPARETTQNSVIQSHGEMVSIHVPARETTTYASATPDDNLVSIHVPARETTMVMAARTLSQNRFQSTFPRGKRP